MKRKKRAEAMPPNWRPEDGDPAQLEWQPPRVPLDDAALNEAAAAIFALGLEARLAVERLEARLVVLEAQVNPGSAGDPQPPETPVQPAYVAPDGVVPPHVKRNLDKLAEWTHPERWQIDGEPGEQQRTRTVLAKLHSLVLLAAAGEDVPTR